MAATGTEPRNRRKIYTISAIVVGVLVVAAVAWQIVGYFLFGTTESHAERFPAYRLTSKTSCTSSNLGKPDRAPLLAMPTARDGSVHLVQNSVTRAYRHVTYRYTGMSAHDAQCYLDAVASAYPRATPIRVVQGRTMADWIPGGPRDARVGSASNVGRPDIMFVSYSPSQRSLYVFSVGCAGDKAVDGSLDHC